MVYLDCISKQRGEKMSYQSEAELERQLIKQLTDLNYQPVQISDEQALLENFKTQFSNHNAQALKGEPLSDKEFERVRAVIEGKSIFQSAQILRDKFVIERENGEKVHLELFDKTNWCKNQFQVTSQITMVGAYENRYDVTLLVNGLPLVQIELKRRGLDMKEAFNQICRYRKHSFRRLFNYIQIFVISNGVDTKYFANSDHELMYSQTFFWADIHNERVTQLSEFAYALLEPCQISKMIARYMVLHQTSKSLMVMRPYQVYAVEKLVERAIETNNNGYVWHTTGSGKTLTSFKLSQVLAQDSQAKKIFFLVDRRDLDGQTIREFNAFEPGSVDGTDKTHHLVAQIKDRQKKLIVTTIQKMSNAIRNPRYKGIMDDYKEEPVIFIIDECHRSQFGKMHRFIQNHFQKAQYFGFTGTPRFKENRSADGRTTADIFEKCLHQYLIKDAIRDQNVLGFSVEYIKTIQEHVDESDTTQVSQIDKAEVLNHQNRVKLVTQHILKNHGIKTRERLYTGLFAVESTEMLCRYYQRFKAENHDLKIAAIFTFKANEEAEGKTEHSRDQLEQIIQDYNQLFGTTYSTDTFDQYFADVSKRVKNAEIDLLLVVDMFLTGFDAKTLNTLYVDKPLKYHNLIQAFSRTNRIEKSTKPYGNIVCYRNLKKETDEAICLFSKTDSTDVVLMESFEVYLERFKKEIQALFKIAKTPQAVDALESEDEMKSFILAFREATRTLTRLQTFTKFSFDEEQLGLSEQDYQDFKSKYYRIYDQIKQGEIPKTSILNDIDFCLELMHTDRINVAYILQLLRDLDLRTRESRQKGVQNLLNFLNRADHPELRSKVALIKSFLEFVVPSLPDQADVGAAFDQYTQEEALKAIQSFAEEVELDEATLHLFLNEYRFTGRNNHALISSYVKAKFIEKKRRVNRIKAFVVDHLQKFN